VFYRESEDNNSLPMVLSEPKEVAMKFRCIAMDTAVGSVPPPRHGWQRSARLAWSVSARRLLTKNLQAMAMSVIAMLAFVTITGGGDAYAGKGPHVG